MCVFVKYCVGFPCFVVICTSLYKFIRIFFSFFFIHFKGCRRRNIPGKLQVTMHVIFPLVLELFNWSSHFPLNGPFESLISFSIHLTFTSASQASRTQHLSMRQISVMDTKEMDGTLSPSWGMILVIIKRKRSKGVL